MRRKDFPANEFLREEKHCQRRNRVPTLPLMRTILLIILILLLIGSLPTWGFAPAGWGYFPGGGLLLLIILVLVLMKA